MSQQQPQEEPRPASAAGRVAAPPLRPGRRPHPAQAAPPIYTQMENLRARLEQEDSTSLDYLLLRRQGQQTLDAVNALTSKIDRLVTALEGNLRVDNEAASFARAYPPHLAPVQGTPPSPTPGRAFEATGRRHRLARPTVTPADYYRDRPDLRHVAVPSQASDDAGDASTGTTAGRYRPPKVDFPKFDGTRSSLDAFLIQSEVWRSTQSIPSDRRMIEIVGLNLKGRAQEWWVSKIKADPDRVGAIFQNWETFKLRLKALYGNIDPGTEALSELMALRQSAMPKRSASEYVERFTALLLRSNLDNDEMAVTLFKTGLEPEFLEPFERSPPRLSLTGIATSTRQADPRVDKKLAEARALRNQRRAAGLCLGCGEAGHFLADCTKKESSKMVALLTVLEDLEASSDEGTPRTRSPPPPPSRTRETSRRTSTDGVLGPAKRLAILLHQGRLPPARTGRGAARQADEREDVHGNKSLVTTMTTQTLRIGDARLGSLPLLVADIAGFDVVLGFPMLQSLSPPEYRDFADVFSEKEADRLPPHGERDLKIELEEGAKPPQGPLYPKGPRELQELRRYLDEMLGKGFIRPSRSPARSPVLYVPKKDGSLRLCVDYRGLNKITVKNRTPLPLIDEMLGLLRRARSTPSWTARGTVVNTFRDILGVYVVIYLDDFFIFSDNPADHTKHVREVLRRLREHRLFCKLSKCQFNTTEADSLATSSRQRASPWKQEDQGHRGIVKPVQRFRKFELPRLPNGQEHDGLWHPVAFYSRKMTSAEANYEIHDKELLAVVASLRHWYQFLAGLPSRFGVLTDHDALKYFATQRWISRRQARWALHLADFDFEIVYRPGKLGGEPDALTRRSDMTSKEGDDADANYRTVLSPSLFVGAVSTRRAKARASLDEVLQLASRSTLVDLCKAYQPLDPWLKTQLASVKRREGLAQKADGLWYVHDRLVVPEIPSRGRGVSAAQDSSPRLSREHLRYMVMTQVHDSQPAGHPGRDATLEHAQRLYYWPNMKSWVADYVASCDACARTKRPRHRPYGYLQPLKTPDRPWGSISADFIEGLPLSDGYDSILVVVDRLTKTAVMVPTTKDVTSAQTAALFEKHVFSRFGLPDDVTTDRGRQFISEGWRTFAQKHGFAHNLSTAYHPQTDGQTERVNQDRIREAQARSVRNYNNKHQDQQFQPGDLVWVSNRNWKTHRPSKKLGNSTSGPFEVLERIGRVAYRLKLLPHMRVRRLPREHAGALPTERLDGRKDEEVEQVVEGADYYEVAEYWARQQASRGL
ncbi:uncharacterized protein PSFLO_07782 [Pseudozyma flocculosa]|uniref:Reverse transcriptase n=1 Tax=Pseudozyma flocculosa TaxID=84751 RepID=A0A5C3FG12_9BASI|nr:uncharacterized protein PSFLO_07782 [Pseudozyma flocculosa]